MRIINPANEKLIADVTTDSFEIRA